MTATTTSGDVRPGRVTSRWVRAWSRIAGAVVLALAGTAAGGDAKALRVDEVPTPAISYHWIDVRSFPDVNRAAKPGAEVGRVRVAVWAPPGTDAESEATLDRIAGAWRVFPGPLAVSVEVFLVDPALRVDRDSQAWRISSTEAGRGLAWYARRVYMASPNAVLDEAALRSYESREYDADAARAGKWGASKPFFQDANKGAGKSPTVR